MIKTLSTFVGFLYIVMGIFVLYYKTFLVPLNSSTAYGLGALLIAYGIFRVFRQFLIKRTRDEEV